MSDLTDAQEYFCQLIAAGYTQTKASQKAYPDNKNPRQQGCNTARNENVKERIMELKRERAEVASMDVDEQIRRYTELYFMALDRGKIETAAKMLERIDQIGGFDAPTKSISIKGSLNESTKALKGDNLKKDLEKFSGILGKHHEKPEEDTPKSIH